MEPLIGVAIVGMLAVIVYPSYGVHRERSRIAQAVADIKETDARLQQFWAERRAYPDDLAA